MTDDDYDEKIETLIEARDSLSEAIGNLERAREHAPQPAAIVDGVYRFRANPIVRNLLNSHPTENMNTIGEWKYERADYAQFLQLIGYSISGIPHGSDHQIDGAQQSAELLEENATLKARVAELEAERDIEQMGQRDLLLLAGQCFDVARARVDKYTPAWQACEQGLAASREALDAADDQRGESK